MGRLWLVVAGFDLRGGRRLPGLAAGAAVARAMATDKAMSRSYGEVKCKVRVQCFAVLEQRRWLGRLEQHTDQTVKSWRCADCMFKSGSVEVASAQPKRRDHM